MMKWLVGGVLAIVGLAAVVLGGAYFVFKRDDIPYERLAARYESAASRYVDLPGGIHMHYRDEGRAGGPTLLLIHGFSASLHTWEGWVRELGGEYRIVAIDLPGHGLTRAPAGYRASIEAFRDAVADFTRAQGITQFALAGSSMGGNVAWEYALAHPGQVQALILVGASGWPPVEIETDGEPLVFRLLRNPLVGPVLRDLDNTRLIREGLQASFYDPAFVDDTMVGRYADLARAPGHRDILLQIASGFNARNYATPERLAALGMPVLILHGDTDRLVPPQHGQQFADAIRGSTHIVYEQTGHIPQEEITERSAGDVRTFLQRALPNAPAPTALAPP